MRTHDVPENYPSPRQLRSAAQKLRKALAEAAWSMEAAADEIAVEATDYQEHAVDERYRPVLARLIKAAKHARKVIAATAGEEDRG